MEEEPETWPWRKYIEILPDSTVGQHAATFCIQNEDHTLTNALRYIIMKNPDVEFCGYSAPHPSEDKVHLRIQMYDQRSATEALLKGLDDLEDLFKVILSKYQTNLSEGNFIKEQPRPQPGGSRTRDDSGAMEED